jgi:5'-deoxynucleotidase YfbR-like HD superfamily hydrolase
MLQSGAEFDFLDPSSSAFTIEDIAHGLAHVCRYAGQCRNFYSVAEHSVLVSDLAGEHAFAALLHDAAEAFLGDVTRPLKQLLPEYKRLERLVERAIFDRFGVAEIPSMVKDLDLAVLAAEQDEIMPSGTARWAEEAGVIPAQITVQCLSPTMAKELFLQRFEALRH